MKKLFVFILSLFSLASFGQIKPEDVFADGIKNEFVFVFESELTQSQLYNRSKYWAAQTYKDVKSACVLEDSENFKLLYKGNQDLNVPAQTYFENSIFSNGKTEVTHSDSRISYTLGIDCKNNKFRIKLSNLVLEYNYKSKEITGSARGMGVNTKVTPNIVSYFNTGVESYTHHRDSIQALIDNNSIPSSETRAAKANIESYNNLIKQYKTKLLQRESLCNFISSIINSAKSAIEKEDSDDEW